jgi:dihydroorotate dehydrogenase
VYSALFSLLRRLDPEWTHEAGMAVIRAAGLPGLRSLVGGWQPSAQSETTVMGLSFRTPFGLAAGFDKDAVAVAGLGALGFGHVEVGTVTPRAQPGNPTPRLFRLPDDQALINRMGFNNSGALAMARRLQAIRHLPGRPVVGVNIGKNRVTPAEEAASDYAEVTRVVAGLADYLVVNVSSPNTPGLRALGDVTQLEPLVGAVLAEAGATPVLVKVSPDAADEELHDVARFVADSPLAGLVATNTTVQREGLKTPAGAVAAMGEGGVSGRPLAERSLDVLEMTRDLIGEKCLISVGGVMTGQDVNTRLSAGADLVQAYTAFVYRGPLLARHIDREMYS